MLRVSPMAGKAGAAMVEETGEMNVKKETKLDMLAMSLILKND
jgi:hypothetical protein